MAWHTGRYDLHLPLIPGTLMGRPSTQETDMAASIKQMNFIKNLFKKASDGTEKLVAAGQDEVVASFAAKVQPLEDILIGVLNDREISGQDARQAIDTLIEVTRQIKVALPKPAQPVGLAALNADKVIPNRFGKKCSCGTMVNPGEGFAALVRGR